jgi:hypothetical protein
MEKELLHVRLSSLLYDTKKKKLEYIVSPAMTIINVNYCEKVVCKVLR